MQTQTEAKASRDSQDSNEWQEGQTQQGYTLLCKGIRQRRVAQAFAKHADAECWLWGANHFCVVRRARPIT